jgi:alcohol dehydrogenase
MLQGILRGRVVGKKFIFINIERKGKNMNANVLSYCCPTKIFMGIESHQKLQEIIKEWKIKKIFVVADNIIIKTEIFSLVEKILRENEVALDLYSDIEPEPSAATVEKAFALYKKNQAPCILAVGGGSTIDTGKGVGILATNGGRIKDYEGIMKYSIPPLPLIAMPTTAGTGSEVSGSCAITDTDRGLKMSIRHAVFNPAKIAILDPIALTTLPASVALHAAIDAFVHAFESYISLNANLVTDALNLHAMELISQNIRQFVANRSNLQAGLNMACGSTLAGMTFGLTGAGNVHCMARFVGPFCHVSHGLSNAICLPYVAEFNQIANPHKYARVAVAMGENIHSMTIFEAANKATDAIKQLCKNLGIPERLRELGATEDQLPEMAQLSFKAGYNKWNPRFTTEEDFLDLFKKAY